MIKGCSTVYLKKKKFKSHSYQMLSLHRNMNEDLFQGQKKNQQKKA